MMAINFTTKYSPLLAERFRQTSFTEKYAGQRFDFDGAKSVAVYTVDKVTLGDYNKESAGSRFGAISELGDTKQIMTMTQDKAFTFSIDHGNSADQVNVKHCNEQLKANWDEVCTPEIDRYRLAKWTNGAGVVQVGDALTKTSVMAAIMSATATMSNNLVPRAGRVLFIGETLYATIKLSAEVTGIDTLGREVVSSGVVGRIDGMDVVVVPDVYMPTGAAFVIKHRDATVDPMKLKTMRVQKNPPGYDADIGECRFYHDSFVLDSKLDGIYVYATDGVALPVITVTSGEMSITTATTGATIWYTLDGSNPKTSETAIQYTDTDLVGSNVKIRAYAKKSGTINSGISVRN
ncbi:MAG: chitobiase/beta-hexosaminidase C-terminal domain-containing protein [Oscillospiraceae bacterium]|nr:chitobiase/beta-hexosaminidase C-terminal domain-containing protein [Oscillospiraceae bacterium]